MYIAVSSSTDECYVVLLYTGVATPPAGNMPVVGLRGQYDALDIYSDGVPASTASALLTGSTSGSSSGTRVYRVDGVVEPGARRLFVPTQSAGAGGKSLTENDDVPSLISLAEYGIDRCEDGLHAGP